MHIVIADLNDKNDRVLACLEKTLSSLRRRLAMGPPPPADVIRAQIARVLANMSNLKRAALRLAAAEVEMLSIDPSDSALLQESVKAIERVTDLAGDRVATAAESLLMQVETFASAVERIGIARSFG